MRRVIAVLVVGLIVGVAQAGFAQDLDDQAKPAQAAAAAKPTPAPAAKEEPPKRPPMLTTNVQVEITITDQLGSGAPTKKTVSLITADGSMGRIRSYASARPSDRTGNVPVTLNVDALPRMLGEQVQLNLTIEYAPLKTVQEGNGSEASQTSPTSLNQSLTVVMTSGKSMIVSQAADPVTDRKIVVEAKATILK